jgi:hypothetical protein
LNDIGRNSLLGNKKKIAKFLMRTFIAALPSSMLRKKKGEGIEPIPPTEKATWSSIIISVP